MRGAPRDSATLFNMIDGVFAVAITLSPTALPQGVRHEAASHLVLVTTTLLLIALTMMLLWLKLRTIVQQKERLTYTDVVCVGVILMVAVMIPQSGYLALRSGHLEGSIWAWSDAQWVNVEYQGLLLLVESALLLLSLRTMGSARARGYPRAVRRWILGVEVMGFLSLMILVLIDNMIVGINGLYIYAIPLILLTEEGLCLARMKHYQRTLNGRLPISEEDKPSGAA